MSTNVQPLKANQSSNVSCREISRAGLARAVAVLADNRPLEIAKLLPEPVCHAVVERYSGPFPAMSEGQSSEATVILLSGFPHAFKGDVKEKILYMRRMESVFALFPEWAGKAVIAAGTGLASKLKFLPSESELTEALTAQVTKARAYAIKAQQHIDEGLRRAKQQELDDACSKLSVEARSALVAKAFAQIRPIDNEQTEANPLETPLMQRVAS